jgi:hypothetical protein
MRSPEQCRRRGLTEIKIAATGWAAYFDTDVRHEVAYSFLLTPGDSRLVAAYHPSQKAPAKSSMVVRTMRGTEGHGTKGRETKGR